MGGQKTAPSDHLTGPSKPEASHKGLQSEATTTIGAKNRRTSGFNDSRTRLTSFS